jgi:hypothetical protein
MVLIARHSARFVALRMDSRRSRRILASAALAQFEHAVVIETGLGA